MPRKKLKSRPTGMSMGDTPISDITKVADARIKQLGRALKRINTRHKRKGP